MPRITHVGHRYAGGRISWHRGREIEGKAGVCGHRARRVRNLGPKLRHREEWLRCLTHPTRYCKKERFIEPSSSRAHHFLSERFCSCPVPRPHRVSSPNPASIRIPDTSPPQGVRGQGQGKVQAEQFGGKSVMGLVPQPNPLRLCAAQPQ